MAEAARMAALQVVLTAAAEAPRAAVARTAVEPVRLPPVPVPAVLPPVPAQAAATTSAVTA